MGALKLVAALCIVAMAKADMGESDAGEYDALKWGYQWYEGEAFKFTCTHTETVYAVWETPNKDMITSETAHSHYEVSDSGTVKDGALLVKEVASGTSGVYFCHMYNDTTRTTPLGKRIYGLNIHEGRYHSNSDRYSKHITVAVIATAVFVVPLLIMGLTYKFQYEHRHPTSSNGVNRKYMYSGNDQEMKQTGGHTDTVNTIEEKGAYENASFAAGSTQM